MEEILSVIAALIGVIALILFTYYGTRWLGKRVKLDNSGMMKVIERVNVGRDKAIVILSVGSKYYLIGISQDHIEKIDILDSVEIANLIDEKKTIGNQGAIPDQFSKILEKLTRKNNKDGD